MIMRYLPIYAALLLAGCSGADFTVAEPRYIVAPGFDGGEGEGGAEAAPDDAEAPPDALELEADVGTVPETSPDAGAPDVEPEASHDAGPADTVPPAPDTAPETAPIEVGPTFTITNIDASNLAIGSQTVFTIHGMGMPSTLTASAPNCTASVVPTTSTATGGATTRYFSCIAHATGTVTVSIFDGPGHVVYTKDFTFHL